MLEAQILNQLKQAGDSPFTGSAYAAGVLNDTWETVCNVTGSGKAYVIFINHGSVNSIGYLDITVDGTQLFANTVPLLKPDRYLNCISIIIPYRSSLLVKQKTTNYATDSHCLVLY